MFALTAPRDESMSEFKIKMARIEAASGHADTQVCITFQIESVAGTKEVGALPL
jgi:hypothetical protein